MKFNQRRDDLEFLVVIGTFGDQAWAQKATERAIPSAMKAIGDASKVVHTHAETLAQARNLPAMLYGETVDWIVFLDADDELDENYISAMQERIKALPDGDFIIQPSTLAVVDGVEQPPPTLIPPKPSIYAGNHCVIGSAVPARLFIEVGGFGEWEAWEDWALWIACHQAGAEFTTCPEAVYRIGIDTTRRSRNELGRAEANRLYRKIRRHYEALR